MPHGIAYRVTLRIKHRCLRCDYNLCFHLFTISAEGRIRPVANLLGSCEQAHFEDDYFKTTTSSVPWRRSTLTPTSPSSCLVSKRSTRASATFNPRIVTCCRKRGKIGFEKVTLRSGADTFKPRQASSRRNTAPDAHDCGAHATG